MTESFPGPANTTASHPPLQPEQLEITPADIAEANKDTLLTALFDHQDRLQASLRKTTSHVEIEALRSKIIETNSAERLLAAWNEDEPFGEFVDKDAFSDNPTQWALGANNWLDNAGPWIANVMRAKATEEAFKPSQPQSAGEPIKQKAEALDQAQQERAVTDARESVERARGFEIINDVVKIAKNKTHLYADVINGFRDHGDRADKNTQLYGIPSNIVQEANRNSDWRQQLNEAVVFTDVVDIDKRSVERTNTERGRFGRTHNTSYTDTEVVPNSEHPKLIRNALTGQDEPAVRFRYKFQYGIVAQGMDGRELPPYKEFRGGRAGQTIAVGMELPKSIADKLQDQLEQDPKSVRQLVERLFLENSDGSMTEEYWKVGGTSKNPVRPPYEKLPIDWEMTVVKGREVQGSSGRYDVSNNYTTEQLLTNQ